MITVMLRNLLAAPIFLKLLIFMMLGTPVLVVTALFFPNSGGELGSASSALPYTVVQRLALVISSIPLVVSACLILLRRPLGRIWGLVGFPLLSLAPAFLHPQSLPSDQILPSLFFLSAVTLVGYYYFYRSGESREYFRTES